jgi:DNA-binding CsgD family transcriptional regulator
MGERLYVSRRTVQTHIAHVRAKPNLTSHLQFAAEVTRNLGNEKAGGGAGMRA